MVMIYLFVIENYILASLLKTKSIWFKLVSDENSDDVIRACEWGRMRHKKRFNSGYCSKAAPLSPDGNYISFTRIFPFTFLTNIAMILYHEFPKKLVTGISLRFYDKSSQLACNCTLVNLS